MGEGRFERVAVNVYVGVLDTFSSYEKKNKFKEEVSKTVSNEEGSKRVFICWMPVVLHSSLYIVRQL